MMHPSTKAFRSVITWVVFGGLLLGYMSRDPAMGGGEMYRWVDEHGRIHLTDTPPKFTGARQDLKVYKPSTSSIGAPQDRLNDPPAPDAGGTTLTPTKAGGTLTVEAVLNRRLTVPLVLDTGADFTVLTKQAAHALRLPPLNRLPRLQFGTAGGLVHLPITTLQSVRVGTAEVRDVPVAIDIDGHMPEGLLGMSFLRHFKVTVDHPRGLVRLER